MKVKVNLQKTNRVGVLVEVGTCCWGKYFAFSINLYPIGLYLEKIVYLCSDE